MNDIVLGCLTLLDSLDFLEGTSLVNDMTFFLPIDPLAQTSIPHIGATPRSSLLMSSRLLTIPIELRLKICRSVIVNRIVADVRWFNVLLRPREPRLPDLEFERDIKEQIEQVRWSLTLLLVNKQMKVDVEQLLLKKNWVHFEGYIFHPRPLFTAAKPCRSVGRFFDDIADLNNVYRVKTISLPVLVLPAMLRWYCGEHRNMCSLSEIIFYDGEDVECDGEGNEDTRVVRAEMGADDDQARAVTLAKAKSLAFLGECWGGFLPNELGVVLHFELFVNKTEVRIVKVFHSEQANCTAGVCGEAGQR